MLIASTEDANTDEFVSRRLEKISNIKPGTIKSAKKVGLNLTDIYY